MIMERDCKSKKQKREICEKRSPLQNLNRLPILKPITKKSSNLSSSSSAPSVSREDPKFFSRFLLSSNSSSSSSSYSRINHDERSKTFSRSKENQISQKSKKNQPQHHARKVFGKINTMPVCKSGPRSKPSSSLGKPEKGSQEFQVKTKNSRENGSGKRVFESSNLNSADKCTPVGRATNGHGLNSANFVDHETVVEDLIYERENCDSGNAVKTPPVEASLSPDIQRHSNSKLLVLKSAATPVCYGAGHLLSGVTDKRKRRRRGSLRGGSEKVNLFDGDEDVSDDLKESWIPSLAEASVRWHLSPCNEGGEDLGIYSRHKLDQFRMICDDDALVKLDLLSSNSMLCGNESDLLGGESSYSVSDDGVSNKRRNRNAILSPREASEFEGLLKPLNYNVVGSLLVTSPDNGIHSREEKHVSENRIGDNSNLSIGSLSIEKIIQTPGSDSSSDVCVGRSRLEMHSSFVWPELDSITKTMERVNLSPRNEMPMWDAPGLGIHFPDMASPPVPVGPTQLQKNVDSVSSSWVSDTTFGILSLSHMRVSWRDGLGSGTVGTDEFDCCCFLSDEEVNPGESAWEQLMGDPSCYPGAEAGQNKENDLRMGNDLSPVVLDYEPCISKRGKEKSSSHRADACAESICTNGGGLVASDDSD